MVDSVNDTSEEIQRFNSDIAHGLYVLPLVGGSHSGQTIGVPLSSLQLGCNFEFPCLARNRMRRPVRRDESLNVSDFNYHVSTYQSHKIVCYQNSLPYTGWIGYEDSHAFPSGDFIFQIIMSAFPHVLSDGSSVFDDDDCGTSRGIILFQDIDQSDDSLLDNEDHSNDTVFNNDTQSDDIPHVQVPFEKASKMFANNVTRDLNGFQDLSSEEVEFMKNLKKGFDKAAGY